MHTHTRNIGQNQYNAVMVKSVKAISVLLPKVTIDLPIQFQIYGNSFQI